MSHHHLSWEELELFELGRASEAAEARIDEHLLICEMCRQTCQEVRSYVNLLRRGLVVSQGIRGLHSTDSGIVVIHAQEREPGSWVGRVTGASLDAGCSADSLGEVLKRCRAVFTEMFPDHVCGPGCRTD